MKQLTKAEEEIMQHIWQLEKTSVKEIIKKLSEPKPAYNTVSTIIRILENKGFVDHEQDGKGYLYFPIVKKSDYSHDSINKLIDGYFHGSFKSMVSFFMKKSDLNIEDLEEILNEIESKKGKS
ncbi:MAG: BlaI/MecI/CopY family transcriptional regulator [Flavobacterium sp.]